MVVLIFYSFVLYLSTEITTHKSRFLRKSFKTSGTERKNYLRFWGKKAIFSKSSPCSISFFRSQRFWEEVILENVFPQFETLSSAEMQPTGISNMLVKIRGSECLPSISWDEDTAVICKSLVLNSHNRAFKDVIYRALVPLIQKRICGRVSLETWT